MKPVFFTGWRPFLIVLLTFWFLPGIAGLYAQPVNFPDSNLQTAVETALGLSSGPVTVAEMATLTNLPAGNAGIHQTPPDCNTPRIFFFWASIKIPVTNFGGLTGLTNLAQLDFSQASLTGISFMTNLSGLKLLYLSGNQITDVSPLAGLTRLDYLRVNFNAVTNPGPLSSLTGFDDQSGPWRQRHHERFLRHQPAATPMAEFFG